MSVSGTENNTDRTKENREVVPMDAYLVDAYVFSRCEFTYCI